MRVNAPTYIYPPSYGILEETNMTTNRTDMAKAMLAKLKAMKAINMAKVGGA